MEENPVMHEILSLLTFALENEDWSTVDESIIILQEELGIFEDFEEVD